AAGWPPIVFTTQGRVNSMNYYALFYEVVDDFVARRAPFRGEHLRLAADACERGDIILAGALAEPADRAVIVCHAADKTKGEVDDDERLPTLDAAEVFPCEPRLADQRPDQVLRGGAVLLADAHEHLHPARRRGGLRFRFLAVPFASQRQQRRRDLGGVIALEQRGQRRQLGIHFTAFDQPSHSRPQAL